MENFVVSARKYRPLVFDSVVGQRSITTTLKNAIKNNHLGHAYLFCGPRGVGKTTCARIFAKTINCFHLDTNMDPCNECESCVAFNQSRSYNIHELDAASNNSVEDIRLLTDQVRISPQVGKYSVYIIDEVHMLSSSAFNAFLKTLEEPPAHAIFILATTEKHKILPTILSRCQIFDFNRIRVEDAAAHLEYVAKSEGVDAEADALHIIAQKADGAMRDALSLFDQIVSFSGQKVSYQDAIDNLNVLDYEFYFKLTDCFFEENIAEALLIFNEILNKGFDGLHFISGLSSHFRDLLVCLDPSTVELLEVGASIKKRYLEQAGKCSMEFLFTALQITNKCELSYKSSQNHRLQVELALLQLCNILKKKTPDAGVDTPEIKAPKKNTTAAKSTENTQREVAPTTTGSVKKNPEPAKVEPAKDEESQLPPPEEPAKTVSSPRLGRRRASISQVLSGETPSEQNDTQQEELPGSGVSAETPFGKDELFEAWLALFDKYKAEKPRMAAVFRIQKPEIGENFLIHFSVANTLQEKDVLDEKPAILSFLRKRLNNRKVELKISISKTQQQSVPITPEDKFNFLQNKNPEVAQLRQIFGLDIQ